MLSWAIDCTKDTWRLARTLLRQRFLDSTRPNFRQVLATEVAKSSVKSALYNIKTNGVNNLRVVRLSAEEVVEATDEVREFRRLKYANIDLKIYDFKTVFVDPPRAGMDAKLRDGSTFRQYSLYLLQPNHPKRQPRDLGSNLSQRFALFDQFPYTHHTEAGVLLERRE